MEEFNIAEFRKSKGLKQKEFAEITGVGQSYLSEIESGKRIITKEVYNKVKESFKDDDFSRYIIMRPLNTTPVSLAESIHKVREESLISIIESQQRAIENLSETIKILSNK